MASTAAFKEQADQKIQGLAAKQESFAALTPAEKAQLCDEILEALKVAHPDLPALADACVLSQGHESVSGEDATGPWCLEQILLCAWVTGFCNRFKATLETYAKTGECPKAAELRTAENGQVVADVFPLDGGDKMKPTKNWKCELWMQKGKEATQGAMFSQKPRPNSVGLVLGAGNVGALAIMDCLHLLFQHNTVVLYKLHPVREYQESFARKLFAPLISKGFFDTIKEETKENAADAQYLTSHPALCQIHMTGATETHDAIVWGPKEGREERKKKHQPKLDLDKVNVTSELGCVTPYIIAPGEWSETDLVHHALHLAVCMTGNNGYYCNSPKVLLLADFWPQKDAFVQILSGILEKLPPIAPYYPGTHRRYQGFEAAYGEEQLQKIKGPGFGTSAKFGDHIPWTLVNISADAENLEASSGEYAFKHEPFCPILTVCTIKNVTQTEPYLEKATTLANKYIWGRLSCSLIVHPETQSRARAAVEKALADLEYGTIVVNAWSALGYGFETGVWGAYAGGEPPLERIECLESGLGFVNNALAFDHIEKCVVRCPFIDKDNQVGTGKNLQREGTLCLTNFLVNPSFKNLLKMIFPRMLKCL